MIIASVQTVIDPTGSIDGAAKTVAASKRVKDSFDKLVSSYRGGQNALAGTFGKIADTFRGMVGRLTSGNGIITGAFGSMARGVAFSAGAITGSIRGIRGAFGSLASGIGGMVRGVVNGFAQIGLAVQGVQAVFAPAVGLLRGVIDSAAEMEGLKTVWAHVLGSFDAADAKMKSLVEYQKSTPFDLPGINRVATMLTQLNEPLFDAENGLKLIGNAAAKAQQPIYEVGNAVQKTILAMQAGTGGGQYIQNLEQWMIITAKEMVQLQELGQEPENFAKGMEILKTALERNGGAMQLFSTKWDGMVNTMSAAWDQLKATIGAPIIEGLKPLINDITLGFRGWTEEVAKLQPAILAAATGVSALFRVMKSEGGLRLSFEAATDYLARKLTQIWEFSKTYLGAAFQWIGDNFGKAMSRLAAPEFWSGVGEALVNGVAKALKMIATGITQIISSPMDYMAGVQRKDLELESGRKRSLEARGERNAILERKLAGYPEYGGPSTLAGGPGDLGGAGRSQLDDNMLADLTTEIANLDKTLSGPENTLLPPLDWSAMPETPDFDSFQKEESEAEKSWMDRFTGFFNEITDQILATKASNEQLVNDAKAANDAASAGGHGKSGPSKEQLKAEADLLREITAEAERMREALATPQEAMDAMIKKLHEMNAIWHKTGGTAGLSDEMMSRGIKKAKEDYAAAMDAIQKSHAAALEKMMTPLQKLMRQWGDMKTQAQEAAVGMAKAFETNITGSMMDMITGAKSVKEAFSAMALGIVNDIAKIIIQMLVQLAISRALKGVTGGGGVVGAIGAVAGVFHTGGTVGEGGESRAVSADTFQSARKYHSGGMAGLSPGEVPAILERGEQVLTREQASDQKRRMTGKDTAPPARASLTNINLFDAAQVPAMMAQNPDAILNVIQMNSGRVKRMMQT